MALIRLSRDDSSIGLHAAHLGQDDARLNAHIYTSPPCTKVFTRSPIQTVHVTPALVDLAIIRRFFYQGETGLRVARVWTHYVWVSRGNLQHGDAPPSFWN